MKTLLLLLALIVTTSQAATVRLYFVDPLTNDKDTNAFYVTPIGTNVLSTGGVVTRGITTRYVPASDGYRTNTLAVGHYSITNRSLGSGVVIRVPDSSSLYDYTNLLISGYNIFVTVTNGSTGTSGALTNNETRDVTFTEDVAVQGTLSAPTISGANASISAITAVTVTASGGISGSISGSDINSGTVADARIASTITRDTEMNAADTVVSNGVVSGLAAGSYDLAAAHALGFTNISLIPTQRVVTVTSDNTNIIYATLAGTVAARGTYYWRTAQSSYTNSTGCGIYYDGSDSFVTNVSGSLYSVGGDIFVSSGWAEDLGSSPAVLTVFGTNSTTYTQNSFTTAGRFPSDRLTTNAVYIATDGRDQFGERGNAQRPFLTLQSAITNSFMGDVIYMQPGSYSIGTISLVSRSIVGAGRNQTVLTGNFNMTGTNILLKDFRQIYTGGIPIRVGQSGVGATNTVIEDCWIYGAEDSIFLNTYDGLKAWNCDLESGWDCVADYQDNGNTNALAEFFNCRLYSYPTTFNATPVSIGRTQLRFNGGSITASNAPAGFITACFASATSASEFGRGGRVEINNVKLNYGSTNTTAKAINVTTNMTIRVSGFSIPNSDIIGSTNVTQLDALNIGTNSVLTVTNMSIYFTNQDGTVYRVGAQRIVP